MLCGWGEWIATASPHFTMSTPKRCLGLFGRSSCLDPILWGGAASQAESGYCLRTIEPFQMRPLGPLISRLRPQRPQQARGAQQQNQHQEREYGDILPLRTEKGRREAFDRGNDQGTQECAGQ
jgi:hypothetical protein